MELIDSITKQTNKNTAAKFTDCDIVINNHRIIFNGSYIIGMDDENIIIDNYYIIKKENIKEDIIIFRDENGEPMMSKIDDFYESEKEDIVKNDIEMDI